MDYYYISVTTITYIPISQPYGYDTQIRELTDFYPISDMRDGCYTIQQGQNICTITIKSGSIVNSSVALDPSDKCLQLIR